MSDLLRVIERALLERMDTYHHDPARLAAHIAAALAAAAPPPDRNDLPGRRSRSEPTRCGRLAFVASRRAFDHRGKRMTDSLPPINGTRGAAPDFYDGILAALAVVDAHGAQTVGQSIVNTVDKAKLFARADAYDREVLASLGIKP